MLANLSNKLLSQGLRYQFAVAKKQTIEKSTPQIYNHSLQFDCNDVVAKFMLVQPYHKAVDRSKILLRSFKSLSIRFIDKDKLFVKGSSYTGFDLTLRQLQLLLNFNFENGQQFLVQNNSNQTCQILLIKPQLKNSPTQIEAQGQQDQKGKKTKKKENQRQEQQKIQISLKTQRSSLSAKMSINQFSIIKKVVEQSFPMLSGLESAYETELQRILKKMQRGQIQQQQEYQANNFVL